MLSFLNWALFQWLEGMENVQFWLLFLDLFHGIVGELFCNLPGKSDEYSCDSTYVKDHGTVGLWVVV